jgi:tripartite-type tricarboxylate transporter receptor subunit TctC
VVSVDKDTPIRNLAELVDYAKKNSGILSCAVIGKGRNYFAMAFLKIKNQLTDQHIQVIPYQGDRPALMALLGKHVQVSVNDFSSVRSLIKAGEIRALAVLSPNRDPFSPEVPTSAEQGFPEMDTSSRYLYFAPVKTPDPIVKKLESAVEKALQDKEVKERLKKIEIVADFMNSKNTQEWVDNDYKRWSNIIRVVSKGNLSSK